LEIIESRPDILFADYTRSVACDVIRLVVLLSRSRRALAAETLFLRKQLALFQERKVKPHRAHDSTRLVMVILGRMFSWRGALVNVEPDTFLRWHRKVSFGAGNPGRLADLKSPRICSVSSGNVRRESDLGRGTHRQ
jgi:hypothetical protein